MTLFRSAFLEIDALLLQLPNVFFMQGTATATLRHLLSSARPNYLAGLIITSHNAVWSLGRWQLIALDCNELLENRFV